MKLFEHFRRKNDLQLSNFPAEILTKVLRFFYGTELVQAQRLSQLYYTLIQNNENFKKEIEKSRVASFFSPLKFLLIGPTRSNKAPLITNYSDNHPPVEFKEIKLNIGGNLHKIVAWDYWFITEKSDHIQASQLKGASGILLTFNLEDLNTLKAMERLGVLCRNNAPKYTQILLVGTLTDPEKIVVNIDERKKFTDKHKLNYIQVDVNNRSEIKNVYMTLAEQVINQLTNNTLAIQESHSMKR
jgi:hypothetical protein